MDSLFQTPVSLMRVKRPINVDEDDPSRGLKRTCTYPDYDFQGKIGEVGLNYVPLLNDIGNDDLNHMEYPQQDIGQDWNPLLSSSERDSGTANPPINGTISDCDTPMGFSDLADATISSLQDEHYFPPWFESRALGAEADFAGDFISVSHLARNGLLDSKSERSSLIRRLRFWMVR